MSVDLSGYRNVRSPINVNDHLLNLLISPIKSRESAAPSKFDARPVPEGMEVAEEAAPPSFTRVDDPAAPPSLSSTFNGVRLEEGRDPVLSPPQWGPQPVLTGDRLETNRGFLPNYYRDCDEDKLGYTKLDITGLQKPLVAQNHDHLGVLLSGREVGMPSLTPVSLPILESVEKFREETRAEDLVKTNDVGCVEAIHLNGDGENLKADVSNHEPVGFLDRNGDSNQTENENQSAYGALDRRPEENNEASRENASQTISLSTTYSQMPSSNAATDLSTKSEVDLSYKLFSAHEKSKVQPEKSHDLFEKLLEESQDNILETKSDCKSNPTGIEKENDLVSEENGSGPPLAPWNLKFGSSLENYSTERMSCTSDEEMFEDDFDRQFDLCSKSFPYMNNNKRLDSTSSITSSGSGRRKQKNPVRFEPFGNHNSFMNVASQQPYAENGNSVSDNLVNSNTPHSASRSETPCSDSSQKGNPDSWTAGYPSASTRSSPMSAYDDSYSNSNPIVNNLYASGNRDETPSPLHESPLDLRVIKRQISSSTPESTTSNELLPTSDLHHNPFFPFQSVFSPESNGSTNLENHISRHVFQEKLRRDFIQAKIRSVVNQKDIPKPNISHLMQNPALSLLNAHPIPSAAQIEPLPSFNGSHTDDFFIDGLGDYNLAGEHFKCPYCEIIFTYKTSLYRHIKSFHQIGEVYACDKCGYVSPRKDKFKSHLVVHEREGRVQKHSNNVRHRIKADPLEESYNCPCGYRTWVKSAYDKHMQQHQMGENMGEVPLSCKICGENYKGETEIENHMRGHKENSHYLCDICGFASVQMKKVIEHRRTHTGEKPFECKVCSYRCARRDNLMLHYRKRHKTEAVLPRIRQRVRHKASENNSTVPNTTTTSIPALTYSPQSPSTSSKPSSLQSLLLSSVSPTPAQKILVNQDFSLPSSNPQNVFVPPFDPSSGKQPTAQDLPTQPFSSIKLPLSYDSVLPPLAAPMIHQPARNNVASKETDLLAVSKDCEDKGQASKSLHSHPEVEDKPRENRPQWSVAPIDMNLFNVMQRFSHDEKRIRAIMEAHFNHSQKFLAGNSDMISSLPPFLNTAAVNGEGLTNEVVNRSKLSHSVDYHKSDKAIVTSSILGTPSKSLPSTHLNQYFPDNGLSTNSVENLKPLNCIDDSQRALPMAKGTVDAPSKSLEVPKPPEMSLSVPCFSAQGLTAVPTEGDLLAPEAMEPPRLDSKQCSNDLKRLRSSPPTPEVADFRRSSHSPSRPTLADPPSLLSLSSSGDSMSPSVLHKAVLGLDSPIHPSPSYYHNYKNNLARHLLATPSNAMTSDPNVTPERVQVKREATS